MPFFNSWGLELLVPQLYDLERRVALEAVEILDEACEEEVSGKVYEGVGNCCDRQPSTFESSPLHSLKFSS